MKRRISDWDGIASVRAFQADPDGVPHSVVMTAVRYALEELAELHPGRAVEVRVPPAGAVQILPGATHRRGTPPAVVEMDMPTFLGLCIGSLSWEDAVTEHQISASGERADLASLFPILTPHFYGKNT